MLGGFINVFKPSGEYSGRSVGRVKALLRRWGYSGLSVGHMGTLDPLAEGVLPIAVGRATRLFDYMLDKDKHYIAGLDFGYETTTLDSMGEVTRSGGETTFSLDTVIEACSTLVGQVDQIPPMYSAKSVDGVRAYDLARAGMQVDLRAKRVRIDEVRPYIENGRWYLDIRCGGGTYVRSIIRDLAYALGTYATMTSLVRTESGAFCIREAISLSDIDILDESILRPIDYVLSDYPRIDVEDARDRARLSNGIPLDVLDEDGLYRVYYDDVLQGIARLDSRRLTFITRLI